MNDLFINFPLAYVVKLFDFRISLLKHIKGNPEAGCHYSPFGRPHQLSQYFIKLSCVADSAREINFYSNVRKYMFLLSGS